MDQGFGVPTMGQSLVGLDLLEIYVPFMEGYVLHFVSAWKLILSHTLAGLEDQAAARM